MGLPLVQEVWVQGGEQHADGPVHLPRGPVLRLVLRGHRTGGRPLPCGAVGRRGGRPLPNRFRSFKKKVAPGFLSSDLGGRRFGEVPCMWPKASMTTPPLSVQSVAVHPTVGRESATGWHGPELCPSKKNVENIVVTGMMVVTWTKLCLPPYERSTLPPPTLPTLSNCRAEGRLHGLPGTLLPRAPLGVRFQRPRFDILCGDQKKRYCKPNKRVS